MRYQNNNNSFNPIVVMAVTFSTIAILAVFIYIVTPNYILGNYQNGGLSKQITEFIQHSTK